MFGLEVPPRVRVLVGNVNKWTRSLFSSLIKIKHLKAGGKQASEDKSTGEAYYPIYLPIDQDFKVPIYISIPCC